MQSFYFAGYVQDEIKLTSKLTLSAGLRYETESPYTDRHNRLAGFDPRMPSPALYP
jgi:outer membrane receptor for ferrienterochelin and colicin